ncbi:MAG TPA: glycosyltransferase family 2 protein [Mycobacteriales bacterium]|nr:glycosyltransferase family 2 protein [Mycobacteriales bacterium]
MTRPNPELPIPRLRVAMIATKAPSEPWAVVERTLRGMLDQDFPYSYDVWLATEVPTGKAIHWCRGHGVNVSTRDGVAEYHRDTWPRRTKCKEGNLAYFYDHYGYDRYDVVAQLDADHVPARDYLQHMVRPFADPNVGYVAAPSICDANADKGWTVRGRLYKESTMHGPVQAGCNAGWAPVCIGSHYAVRTQALRDVGGLGPDLAEDYSTTLWLQSGGWDGVFAIDAEAHGDGPETFEAMLTQEYQWARSLGTILTRWVPSKLPSIAFRARVRLLFAVVFYLLQGLMLVAATSLPTIGVITGHTWGSGSVLNWYLHIWPCSLALTLCFAWLRNRGVLRPSRARLWSADVVLFQLVRWPWTTWGFFRGMWEGRRRPAKRFKVTPKRGAAVAAPLQLSLVLPPLLLAVLPTVGLLVSGRPTRTLGLFVVVCVQIATYLATAAAVVGLHIVNDRRKQSRLARSHVPYGRHALRHATNYRLTWAGGGAAAALVGSVSAALIITMAWRIATFHLAFS